MGNCRSMSWSMRVKMAVLAPIPRARDRIATQANNGLRAMARREYRTSRARLFMEAYTAPRRYGYEKSCWARDCSGELAVAWAGPEAYPTLLLKGGPEARPN